MQITNPRRAARRGRTHARARRRPICLRVLADRTRGFVYVARQADPAQAAALQRLKLPGLRLLPRGAAHLPAAIGRGAGARLRGRRQQRPRRARARSSNRQLAGRPGRRRSSRTRAAARSTCQTSDPRCAGQDVSPHARPQHPGERRGGAARHGPQVARARARRAIVLDPRTGAVLAMARRARLRREPLPVGAARSAAQPRRHGHLRARLDVQARDGRGRALGAARRADDALHAPVSSPGRRPRHPRRRGARHGDYDRRADPLALVERRRDHARADARDARALVLDPALRLRAARPGSTSPARARESSCRRRSGRARRSATSRSARASPSRRSRWPLRTRRSRTAASGSQPHLVDHVGGGGRPSLDAAAARVRADRRAADGDAEERRRRGHGHVGRDARLPGRRQDRNRGEARRAGRLLDSTLRRVVRRRRACLAAAPRDPGLAWTSRRARSGAASSPRRPSSRSRSSTCSTWTVQPDAVRTPPCGPLAPPRAALLARRRGSSAEPARLRVLELAMSLSRASPAPATELRPIGRGASS